MAAEAQSVRQMLDASKDKCERLAAECVHAANHLAITSQSPGNHIAITCPPPLLAGCAARHVANHIAIT